MRSRFTSIHPTRQSHRGRRGDPKDLFHNLFYRRLLCVEWPNSPFYAASGPMQVVCNSILGISSSDRKGSNHELQTLPSCSPNGAFEQPTVSSPQIDQAIELRGLKIPRRTAGSRLDILLGLPFLAKSQGLMVGR